MTDLDKLAAKVYKKLNPTPVPEVFHVNSAPLIVKQKRVKQLTTLINDRNFSYSDREDAKRMLEDPAYSAANYLDFIARMNLPAA